MNFSAALLAGGHSSRMGRDKVFLEIDGVPLWRRQLQILQDLGPSEIFIAGSPPSCGAFLRNAGTDSASDTDALQQYCVENHVERLADAADGCGPLGGLVSALRRSTRSHLFVLAIDLPGMTSEFLGRLLAMCSDGAGIVPRRKTSPAQFEPLAAIYPKSSLSLAENSLNSGEYALQEFVRRAVEANFFTTTVIADSEESLFFNLNTPTDLASLAQR